MPIAIVLLLYAVLYSFPLFSCNDQFLHAKPAFYEANRYPRPVHATPLVKLATNIKNLGNEPYKDAFQNKQKAGYLQQVDALLGQPGIDMRGFYEFISPESPCYVQDIEMLYQEKQRAFYAYYPEKKPVDMVAPKKLTAVELKQKYNDIKTNIKKLHGKNGEQKAALEDTIINDIKLLEQGGGTLAGEQYESDQGILLISDMFVADASTRVLNALLQYGGIDSNIQSRTIRPGLTPLMLAVASCKIEAVKYLLSLPHIKIDMENAKKETALLYAARLKGNHEFPLHRKAFLEMIQLLLQSGASIENTDQYTKKGSSSYDNEVARLIQRKTQEK